MRNLNNTQDYPYSNAKDFMGDTYKMEQLVRGCIETFIDTSRFEELVLQSIKDYAGEVGIGYPKEDEETIEEEFYQYEILKLLQKYIKNKMGIRSW